MCTTCYMYCSEDQSVGAEAAHGGAAGLHLNHDFSCDSDRSIYIDLFDSFEKSLHQVRILMQ